LTRKLQVASMSLFAPVSVALLFGYGPSVALAFEPSDMRRLDELFSLFHCQHVYLDVGSNIGVQVRKLFEPQKYLDTPDRDYRHVRRGAAGMKVHLVRTLRVWDEHFGPVPRCNVCAIGLEPNPSHRARLQQVQRRLRAAGAGVLFFEAAASGRAGEAVLYGDGADLPGGAGATSKAAKDCSKGATLVRPNSQAQSRGRRSNHDSRVRLINLPHMLQYVVNRLHRVGQGTQPQVVAKVDLEGAEYALFTALVSQAKLCKVASYLVEWHAMPKNSTHLSTRGQIEEEARKCQTKIQEIDDEVHGSDGFAWSNASVCDGTPVLQDYVSLESQLVRRAHG
jgi:hypothetical protein